MSMNPNERILTIRLQEKMKKEPECGAKFHPQTLSIQEGLVTHNLKGEKCMKKEIVLQPGSIIDAVFKVEVGKPLQSEIGRINAIDGTNITLVTEYETYVIVKSNMKYFEIVETSPLEQMTVLAAFCKANGNRDFTNKITGIIDSMTQSARENSLADKHHEINRKICQLGQRFTGSPEVGLTKLLAASLHILQRNTEQAQETLSQVCLPQELLDSLCKTMSILPERYQNLCQLEWEVPQEEEDWSHMDYQVGTISHFNLSKKLGYIKEAGADCFFHICQIPEDEAQLRFALANNCWHGLEVSYLYGENKEGKAATDLRLVGEVPDCTLFLTGTVETYDVRKDKGTVDTKDGSYTFHLDNVADPFLANYYSCSFIENHQVKFQLKPNKQGKLEATNIRHISTVGESTKVPSVGKIPAEAMAKWLSQEKPKAKKDPFATDYFYPLPLYDFSIPETPMDVSFKAWQATPVEKTLPAMPQLEPFNGTLQELRDCLSSDLSACERRLKHLFGFEFSMVDDYHLSDFQDKSVQTLQAIKKLHPELARLSATVIELNGKDLQQANPSILCLLSLTFVVTCMRECWTSRFSRYFRPVGYDWDAALTQMAKMRNIIAHGHMDTVTRAEMEEVRQICQAFLHM